MSVKWSNLLPYAAGAVTGGVMNNFASTSPYSAAGSAIAGALTNKKSALTGALQGFAGGGVGSAIGGGLTSTDGFGSGVMSGLKTYGNSIPGFGGVGTSNPTGALAKFFTPQSIQNTSNAASLSGTRTGNIVGSGSGTSSTSGSMLDLNSSKLSLPSLSTTGATGDAASSFASTPVSGAPVTKSGLFGNNGAGKALAGLGVSALSSFANPVKAADYSSVTNPLKERINNPSANSQAATNQYLSTLNAANGSSAESGLANAKLISDRQRADNLRSINQQFAAASPGNDYTNSSAYQTAVQKMNSEMDQNYSSQAAQLQYEYDTQQQTQKAAAASALAEMDQAQIQSLANLANLDVYTIAEQTGYDVASAKALQELATQAAQATLGGVL